MGIFIPLRDEKRVPIDSTFSGCYLFRWNYFRVNESFRQLQSRQTLPGHLQLHGKSRGRELGSVASASGYHPHFDFSPAFAREFESGHVFQLFLPVEEGRAGREVIARLESHDPEI